MGRSLVRHALSSVIVLCAILAPPLLSASPTNSAPADGPSAVRQFVDAAPKGSLKNPYADTDATVVEQGRKLYLGLSCNGCHGGSAGGGMCPPISNDIWVYGGDDDTLFRLVTLGSDQLQKAGYTRIAREKVVGPMPPYEKLLKSKDDLWKIMAFLRANYRGSPNYKFGKPKSAAPKP